MISASALVALSAIALLAFFVRGITGSASAIVFNAIFVILLALDLTGGLSLHDGLYWMALVNCIAALMMVGSLRRALVADKLTLLFLAGTLPVNALFALLLTRVDDGGLVLFLALAVMASGVYQATRPELPPADPATLRRLALPVGAAAGVIGGLYGMGGPVTFLLFSRASSDPSVFRARLTVITGTANTLRLIVLATQGVYTTERILLATASLPAVIAGVFLGMWVHRYVRPGPFRRMLGVLITLAGLAALMQTIL